MAASILFYFHPIISICTPAEAMLAQNYQCSLAFRPSLVPSRTHLKLNIAAKEKICNGTMHSKSKFSSPAPCRPSSRRITSVPRAQQTPGQSSSPPIAQQSLDDIPPGCSRYSVSLTKPIGLVLEERKDTKTIVVAEIVPGGAAEKSGLVAVGDILIATNGYTRTTEQMYNEIVVRGGEQMVRLRVQGESFDTVLAAIGSIPGNMEVKLEFQRC